jgi:hypothetical protein
MFQYTTMTLFGLVAVVFLIRYMMSFIGRPTGSQDGQTTTTTTTGDIMMPESAVRQITGIGQGVWYLIRGPELLRKRYAQVSRTSQSSHLATEQSRHKGDALLLRLPQTIT